VRYHLYPKSKQAKGARGNLALVVRVHKRILMANQGQNMHDSMLDFGEPGVMAHPH
jgi:hypothetical protein